MKSQIVGDVTVAFLYPLNLIVHFWLHHIGHCPWPLHAVMHQQKGCMGQGEVGWDHLQGDMHMVATRLGCQSTMVGPILALAVWTGLENTTLTL